LQVVVGRRYVDCRDRCVRILRHGLAVRRRHRGGGGLASRGRAQRRPLAGGRRPTGAGRARRWSSVVGADARLPGGAVRASVLAERRADAPRTNPHGTQAVPVPGLYNGRIIVLLTTVVLTRTQASRGLRQDQGLTSCTPSSKLNSTR